MLSHLLTAINEQYAEVILEFTVIGGECVVAVKTANGTIICSEKGLTAEAAIKKLCQVWMDRNKGSIALARSFECQK